MWLGQQVFCFLTVLEVGSPRLKCQHILFSSWSVESHPLVSTHDRESESFLVYSQKGTNLVMGPPPSQPHLNLTRVSSSNNTTFLGVRVSTCQFWSHTNIQSITVLHKFNSKSGKNYPCHKKCSEPLNGQESLQQFLVKMLSIEIVKRGNFFLKETHNLSPKAQLLESASQGPREGHGHCPHPVLLGLDILLFLQILESHQCFLSFFSFFHSLTFLN